MVMRRQPQGIPDSKLACFLLVYHRTFTGRCRAVCALRLDDRGPFACWERKQDGAHWAPSLFSISVEEIWRPAVSGTGGIQDDRIAGRQKLIALRAPRRGHVPFCVKAIIALDA